MVEFPDQFIEDYTKLFTDAHDILQGGHLYVPTSLGSGIIMLENSLGPASIYYINKILDESLYAEKSAITIPPGFYVSGECYDDIGKIYLMVNLIKDSSDYGKIFFWRKAHDLIGTGDNTISPVHVADSLGAYINGLMTEDQAQAKLDTLR